MVEACGPKLRSGYLENRKPVTPQDLKAIRDRLKGVSQDWEASDDGCQYLVQTAEEDICYLPYGQDTHKNAVFIAHAPTDIAASVEEIHRLRKNRKPGKAPKKPKKSKKPLPPRGDPPHSLW